MTQDNGSIIGQVIAQGSRAIKDATVIITGRSPTHNDIAANTDDYGRFSFRGLIPGYYDILVNAEGFEKKVFQVRVNSGEEVSINCTLE